MEARAVRLCSAALWAAAAITSGCGGGDRSSTEERIDRVEKRYEQLWNAESVNCREAPGDEGYQCTIWGKQEKPDDPRSGYDVEVQSLDSGP